MYITLAQVYDRLMQDVDYPAIADRAEAIFRQFGCAPNLVLDLGCGTGSLVLELAGRGYDMIGVDNSADMLEQAARKARAASRDVLLLCQDIRAFELYGTVGAILATLDVLNHVTNKQGLRAVFRRVRNYLDPGGLFLFDLNSPFKLSKLLPAQPSYQVAEDITWIWDSAYDRGRRVCTFDLTFFIADDAGTYRREDEIQEERAWTEQEMRELLAETGLEFLAAYDGWRARKPGPESERLFFVARRPM